VTVHIVEPRPRGGDTIAEMSKPWSDVTPGCERTLCCSPDGGHTLVNASATTSSTRGRSGGVSPASSGVANFSAWPTPSGKLLRLTVPAKCGTTHWGHLLMMISTGAMPHVLYEYSQKLWLRSHRFAPERLLPCAARVHALSHRMVWLLVVRNPYERLLSAYLDKVARRTKSFVLRYPVQNSSSDARGFREFVQWYAGRPGWSSSPFWHDMNGYAKLHLWPIVALARTGVNVPVADAPVEPTQPWAGRACLSARGDSPVGEDVELVACPRAEAGDCKCGLAPRVGGRLLLPTERRDVCARH
jgi:hypothetical protein